MATGPHLFAANDLSYSYTVLIKPHTHACTEYLRPPPVHWKHTDTLDDENTPSHGRTVSTRSCDIYPAATAEVALSADSPIVHVSGFKHSFSTKKPTKHSEVKNCSADNILQRRPQHQASFTNFIILDEFRSSNVCLTLQQTK